jgi:hypothetical protein
MLYEFTITLRPALYRFTAQEQAERIRPILREVFKTARVKASAVYELTRENNIHVHCLIDLRDHKHRDRLFNLLRPHHATFGRKTCTQLVHYPEYVQYMRKDQDLTRNLINDCIVQDDYEVLGNLASPNYFVLN